MTIADGFAESDVERTSGTDNVPIGRVVSGTGRPLLLVHGTSADHSRWDPVLAALAAARRVHAIDRRGRGHSGDGGGPYSIRSEYGDIGATIAALSEASGGPIDVVAHSYGAICTLEAAAVNDSGIRRLVLYEPPLPVGEAPITPPEILAELEALMAKGDREGVVTTFIRRVVRAPDHEYEMLRASPGWTNRIAAAHTIPRELGAIDREYRFEAARLGALTVPTLLLLGAGSPPFLRAASMTLADTLPDNRLLLLEGQQHNAMSTAPDYFVETVLGFLDGDP